MTKQVNMFLNEYRRTKALAANVIAIATMITMMAVLASSGERSINAQINNGTINLEQTIFQAINSQINTSLTQAMTMAERSVGTGAFAVAAFGSEEGGYFAYRIILATPGMKFYNVKVDPGNGQILETQQVSQKELDKMHKEHSAQVVRNNSSDSVGVSGFPFIIPH
jgi:hypothetical protein